MPARFCPSDCRPSEPVHLEWDGANTQPEEVLHSTQFGHAICCDPRIQWQEKISCEYKTFRALEAECLLGQTALRCISDEAVSKSPLTRLPPPSTPSTIGPCFTCTIPSRTIIQQILTATRNTTKKAASLARNCPLNLALFFLRVKQAGSDILSRKIFRQLSGCCNRISSRLRLGAVAERKQIGIPPTPNDGSQTFRLILSCLKNIAFPRIISPRSLSRATLRHKPPWVILIGTYVHSISALVALTLNASRVSSSSRVMEPSAPPIQSPMAIPMTSSRLALNKIIGAPRHITCPRNPSQLPCLVMDRRSIWAEDGRRAGLPTHHSRAGCLTRAASPTSTVASGRFRSLETSRRTMFNPVPPLTNPFRLISIHFWRRPLRR